MVVVQQDIKDLWYMRTPTVHIRITSDVPTLPQIREMVKEFTHIIATEGTGEGEKKHYHILVQDSSEASSSSMEKTWKDVIKNHFPYLKTNKMFSCVSAKNNKQLTTYVVKDGVFEYNGFTQKEIENFQKISYNVKATKKKFNELKTQFLLGKIDIYDYAERYVQLKVQAGQPLYRNHVVAHLTTVRLSVDNEALKRYANECLDYAGR